LTDKPTLVGYNDTLCYMGSLNARRADFKVRPITDNAVHKLLIFSFTYLLSHFLPAGFSLKNAKLIDQMSF